MEGLQTYPSITVCVAMGFVMDGTYSITLLWNLNSRLHRDNSSHSHHSRSLSSQQRSLSHGDLIDMKPTVSVVRTVQVDSDFHEDASRHLGDPASADHLRLSAILMPTATGVLS
jgi:hypothetical protein